MPDSSSTQTASSQIDHNESVLRADIAKLLTKYALIFLAALVLVTLFAAAVYSYKAPPDDTTKRGEFFFEVAKYLLGTMLPVVAGWVGTVLAFYYGRENFKAGSESMAAAARVLTSKEKLAATTVVQLGKTFEEFKALVLTEEQSKAPGEVTLDKVDPAFGPVPPQDKPYERLPILLAGNVPYVVLHRSTMNSFLVDKLKKDPNQTTGTLTLADLFTHVGYIPEKSFVVVRESDTAAEAKQRMESVKNCSDVFVTADGTAKSAVKRWITNVDLLTASEV
jgi:hypothetical protein